MVDNWWLALILGIAAIFVSCLIICVRKLARRVPVNYLLLLLFTASEAYLVAYGTCFYYRTTVFGAAIMTCGMVLGLTVYAFTTKTDFTMMRGAIFLLGFTIMIFALVTIFMDVYWVNMVIAGLCVILFGFYLLHDT